MGDKLFDERWLQILLKLLSKRLLIPKYPYMTSGEPIKIFEYLNHKIKVKLN